MGSFYDLVFLGNVVMDEVHPFQSLPHTLYGGPVLFCAMATSWSEKNICVVTRMAEDDVHSLDPVKAAGMAVHISPSEQTTYHIVRHLTENLDEREMVLARSAGFYSLADLPDLDPTLLHLAGLDDQEFTFAFMSQLRQRGFTLALDMQSFVRQVDPTTGLTKLADVPQKRDIAALVGKLKLDVVEAALLTDTDDLEEAAIRFEEWGCPEVMVTSADGVVVRHHGKTYYQRYSNRCAGGRTGRGDTTFGSYLARRLDWEVEDSLRFAAALASIKMETPGPFSGTLQQVLDRMNAG